MMRLDVLPKAGMRAPDLGISGAILMDAWNELRMASRPFETKTAANILNIDSVNFGLRGSFDKILSCNIFAPP
jgi:hypothetical protein